MYVDALTVGALVLIGSVIAIMYGASRKSQAEAQKRIEELEGRVSNISATAFRPTKSMRELCIAVHRLFPNAVAWVDFQIVDEGNGAFLSEWFLPAPKPSADQLRAALADYKAEEDSTEYHDARLSEYPSIGDQLDALYKARQGDATELREIDARIHATKNRHPKPGGSC